MSGLTAALLAFSAGVVATAETAVEDYPLPGHGELRLQVPADWQVRFTYTEDASTPPSLHVFPLAGEAFEMFITVYWHDGLDIDITSVDALHQRVRQAGNEALQGSTDKTLTIVPFEGAPQPGFLYDLEDANAADGEYRYLTQGAVAAGQLVLAFTILTHERPSEYREACLRFLRTARQVGAFQGISASGAWAASAATL